jgi:glycosyltransferase involved in cell wall biosynthesis
MKITVLFLVSTLERGGPTNVIYNIVKYIDREAIEPVILTLSPEPPATRKMEFEALGMKVYSLFKSRVDWMFSSLPELRNLVKSINPDIIHSHSYRPDISSARRLGGYVRMSTIHADLQANYANTYPAIIGNYLAKRQISHVAQLEKKVACSRSVLELYKTRIPDLICIQNGIDEALFQPVESSKRNSARLTLGLPADKKIFVSAGSLCSRKDPSTVIEGFLKSSAGEGSVLLFLGTGILEQSLRDQYANKPSVIFKGFVTNVNEYMQHCDYFISASRAEGLPNTVMEALGCGLPAILSDIKPHQEILEIDKRAGRIFTTGDPSSLAASIDEIMSTDYHATSVVARNIIRNELNARTMTMKYQEVYLRLIQDE